MHSLYYLIETFSNHFFSCSLSHWYWSAADVQKREWTVLIIIKLNTQTIEWCWRTCWDESRVANTVWSHPFSFNFNHPDSNTVISHTPSCQFIVDTLLTAGSFRTMAHPTSILWFLYKNLCSVVLYTEIIPTKEITNSTMAQIFVTNLLWLWWKSDSPQYFLSPWW